ncbi:oxidoreductase [Actinoplanes couchii]|uniref:Oxidoreductase n=1 Tax=Actinoplanes couchii TaxID=403638 RepID=A0ABQ3XFU0_9ACTN|nr:oxidoreductase [Actinoplanes couchii]MDR6321697.1 hypothetical protein [Actinoplanes couchii]GID57347.1 hypothetical protein Aco03nite_057510 [Actinoplanes couchii]
MTETIRQVPDRADDSPVVDVRETFQYYRELLAELKGKIDARFELTRDPSTRDLQAYGGHPDGPGGSLEAYAGPEIDWLVHSWIGDPGAGFANLHLTAWLGPRTRVPHLGITLLVWPGGWFYLDSVPRVNLVEDAGYFDDYYAGADEAWRELRADPEFEYFVSRSGFIRASLSPTAYCYSFETSRRNLGIVAQRAHAHVDRWLRWVDKAPPVPVGRRPALAAADQTIRRNIAERDPVNVTAVRFFGAEMTNRLVRALWGGDRELPRPE